MIEMSYWCHVPGKMVKMKDEAKINGLESLTFYQMLQKYFA